MRPIAGIAPAASAATPPAKNFRRAGFGRDGWQQRQVRKNLSTELALIPSSRFCCGVSLALVPAVFQAPTPRISRSPGEPVICSVAIATFADARLAGDVTIDPPVRRRRGNTSPRSEGLATLGVSKPLLRRIYLTPGVCALSGGRPL